MRLALLSLLFLNISCRDGKLISIPTCEPDFDPQEVCDGRDNDCDGTVDKIVQSCSSDCGPGQETCTNGRWIGCTAPSPKPEVCDGLDNDCDGKFDEDIPTTGCYPLGLDHPSLSNGVCHPGSNRCIYGKFQCTNYKVPTLETCNGLDDNCDGDADEGTGGSPIDIVFAVDYSGSMTNVILSLQRATSNWATRYAARTDLRIALVGIPDPNSNNDKLVLVMMNFGTPGQFATELARWTSASGGGQEPSLDAIHMTSLSSNPLNLTWRVGANRALVVYTDEMPQSYNGITEQQAWDAAVASGLRVFLFSSDSSWFRWSPRPLGLPEALLGAELDKVFDEAACR